MKKTLTGAILTGLLVAACGGGGELTVEDIWARMSASGQDAGAVYMTLTGGDDADQLIAVTVGTEVAAAAEIHETTMESGDSGMMMMQQVSAIDVPAGATVTLEPGGYHVMLMQLAEPLVAGEEIELTLTFAEAGSMQVKAEVREE